MKILKKHLRYIPALILFTLMGLGAHAQTYYDWKGTTSKDWFTPSNWQLVIGGVIQPTNPDYPGHIGAASEGATVYMGVHVSTRPVQPELFAGETVNIGSLDFGDNLNVPGANYTSGYLPGNLQVEGTLNISGALTQEGSTAGNINSGFSSTFYYHQALNYIFSTTGTGIINCASIIVGDGKVPTNPGVISVVKLQFSNQGAAAAKLTVNVAGNITLFSYASKDGSNNIISTSDAEISLEAGTLNLTGQMIVGDVTYNTAPTTNFQPLSEFSMDISFANDNPTLNLYNATPFVITGGANGNSVDFYNITAAVNSTATVNYLGAGNQEVVSWTGTDKIVLHSGSNAGMIYNNIGFGGGGTKTVDAGIFYIGGVVVSGSLVGGNVTLWKGAEIVNISGTTTPPAAAPTVTISGNYTSYIGSTLLKTNASALTIPGTTSNNGTFTHSAGAMTFTGQFTNGKTGVYAQSGSATVTVSGAAIDSGTYNQSGTGSATFNSTFNNAGAISAFTQTGGGTATFTGTASNDGTITQNSTGVLAFPNTFTNTAGSKFILTTGTTNFNNSYTNSGTFTQAGGTVNFNQATSQSLVDNSTSGGTTFSNVFMKNGGTQTMSGSGQFYISSQGLLNVTNSTTLAAGGVLTLRSDTTGSAQVTALASGATVTGTITGNVNVQRYITGGVDQLGVSYRGYRLVSSPVYTAIDATPGHNNNKIYSINYLLNSTYISGTTFPATSINPNSKAGNPSLYLYRENLIPQYTTFLNSNYRGINNISGAPTYTMDVDGPGYNIPIGNGYLFFFRGAEGTASPFSTTAIPLSGPITATGVLNQGNITVANWYTPGSQFLLYTNVDAGDATQGFNLVGNPYASAIDWNTMGATAGSGIRGIDVNNFTYMLVANGDSGSGNYSVYDEGGSPGTNSATNIIPSGAGFFVQAGGTDAQLIFSEGAKVNTQGTGPESFLSKRLPSTSTIQSLRLKMSLDSINSDETVIGFSSQSKTTFVPAEDARYKAGTGKVSLSSLSSDNVQIAINRMPLAAKGDTIKLQVGATASGTYTLKINKLIGIPTVYAIWLKDAFTKDSVNMRTTPNYSFTVNTGDSTTFGANRFKLLVVVDPALAYKLISFDAAKTPNNKQVALTWKTQNEANTTNFTVERSNNNGKTYDAIGNLLSNGSGTYSLLDKDPLRGDNMYRLKQVDFTNTISYSSLVDIQFNEGNGNGRLSCYPNPAINTINLSFDPKSQGNITYDIRVTNSAGMIVKYAQVTEPSWQSNVSNLLTGTYLIQVTNKKDNSVVGQAKFVKL
jgi:trimeric autotransporter adhesin